LYLDLQPGSLYRVPEFVLDPEPVAIIEVQDGKSWSKVNAEGHPREYGCIVLVSQSALGPEPASTPCQPGRAGVACFCSVVLRPLFSHSGSSVLTLMLVSPRRGSLNTLAGCVPGCVSTPRQGLEVLCRREMHLKWCSFVSIPCVVHFFQVKKCIHSPISCAVENRPQEIVFSQLTPPIGNAKVSSTCAAVPFGEVRSHSRVPACRRSKSGQQRNRAAKSGRTSQPLAMLCATRSKLRAARGPLQPIGRE
jgi:hypothetical protein